MVDYRKRLSAMTPEERAEVAPSADNFSKVFGDRTEEPMSVTAADTAVSLATPVDSVVEVQKELQKEEPDYLKIGMLAGVEALGSIPALGPVAKSMVRKGADLAKQTDNVIDTTKTSVESAGLTDESIDAWRKANATSDDFRKSLKGRNQELQDLANKIDDPESPITVEDYRTRADEIRPIRKVTDVPKPATYKQVGSALNAGKRKKPMVGLNAQIPDGDVITARLDIDAYTDYDVWVPTLTHPDLKTVYKPTVVLKDVSFIDDTHPAVNKAKGVAKGKSKAPFAVMTGKYTDISNDEAYEYATSVFDSDEWVQAGYDPTKRGFFYDRSDGQPILAGDEVIQIGHLVLVKNATKGDAKTFGFKEGGMAMEEQTQMAFALGGSVEEVDPVSGNEVPPGSLPEEVRDDIDARLSEGEYVVPADVVRYYGVKFFEDLRTQAKSGFEDMEANGRIGGQPVPEENPLPFDVSELQVEEEPVQMNEGGLLDREALEAKFPASFMGSGGPAQEWKTFENDAGLTITIRFVDGKPMSVIPAGYTEVGARSEQALEAPRGDDSDPQFGDPSKAPEPVDLGKLSEDELEKIGDKAATMGTLEEIVGYGTGPALTQIMRMTREGRAAKVNSEVARRLSSGKNADGTDLTESQITQLGKIFDKTADTEDTGSRFFGGQRTLTEGLQDTSGDEQVNFADTFLGDLMGFDGGKVGIQATDKDGNKLGLDASISGKRRKPVEKPAVGSSGSNDNDSDRPGPNFDGSAINSVTGTSWSDPDKNSGELPERGGGDRGMNKGGLMLKKDKKKKK